MKKLLLSLITVSLLGAFFLSSHIASARLGLVAGNISIVPHDEEEPFRSWFLYGLDPGQEIEDSFEITNISKEAIIVKLYAVDAENTTNGGFALASEGSEKQYIPNWIELEETQVELGPEEMKIIPFKLRVPEDQEEAEYWGGFVVQQVTWVGDGLKNTSEKSDTGFDVSYSVGVRTMVRVPAVEEDLKNGHIIDMMVDAPESLPVSFVNKEESNMEENFSVSDLNSEEIATVSSITEEPSEVNSKIDSKKILWGLVIVILLSFLFFARAPKKKTKKKSKKRKKSKKGSSSLMLFLVVAASVFSLNSSAVYAEVEDRGISIMPVPKEEKVRSWFVYEELDPGTEIKDQANIINLTGRDVTAKIYAVDSTTSINGGFALRDEKYDHVGIGAWIVLDNTEFDLEPGETKVVDFTLKIPALAEVGDHGGALVVTELKEADMLDVEGTGFVIVTNVGARVYATVAGELFAKMIIEEGLSFEVLPDGTVVFTVNVINGGNVKIKPIVIVDIKDTSGAIIETIEAPSIYEIFPGQDMNISMSWENARVGLWEADVKVIYGGKEYAQTLKFNIYPKVSIFLVVGLVIVFVVLLIAFKRRRKIVG